MMTVEHPLSLQDWLNTLTEILAEDQAPYFEEGISFLKNDQLVFELLDRIQALPEEPEEAAQFAYSAHFLAFEICVAQLQVGIEHQNKHAARLLKQLMHYLADLMFQRQHTLSFWLPILNAFYEAHVELEDRLQDAYLTFVEQEEPAQTEPLDPVQSMQEMLHSMADMSVFDIAEHFFSQSHAMPPDFFMDLIFDLCQLPEGLDVAVLFLLHPKEEVRSIACTIFNQLIHTFALSSISLSRLRAIKRWYPEAYSPYFEQWLKIQRKKGLTYALPSGDVRLMSIRATEVDGAGSQGVFIQVACKRKYRICGLLFKMGVGIKDVWLTNLMSKKEVTHSITQTFDDQVILRDVDKDYVQKITNHFLALSQQQGDMPPLYFLEVQEILGIDFYPAFIDTKEAIQTLTVQIHPFTADVLQQALKRTRTWFQDKGLTHSWFEEEPNIDTYVNQCCSFVKGVKVCALDKATELVMREIFEPKREKWMFHFLWTGWWAQVKHRKNEHFWQDCFFVAYALSQGYPMDEIPVLKDIVQQTVMNSLETMGERKSHLNLT